MNDKPKGRPCAACGSPLSDLRSQFVRICSNGKCGKTEQWNLDPGQAPLLGESRDRGMQ
jgi:hypothetical protein